MRRANEFVARATPGGLRSEALCLRGLILFWQGDFDAARKDFVLSDRTSDEVENSELKAEALEGKAAVHLARREFQDARTVFEAAAKIFRENAQPSNREWRGRLAWWLGILAAEEGRPDLSDSKIAEIRTLFPEGERPGWVLEDLLRGEAEFARGDLDTALSAGQRACGPESSYWTHAPAWPLNEYIGYRMDLPARIFAKKGEIARAISEYERLLRSAATASVPFFFHPLYHYRLGLLYEQDKNIAKADEHFRRFLGLWKNADPDRPEIQDARARLGTTR